MTLFPVDDGGRLFISPAIEEWGPLAEHAIDVVIDLEGGLDECVPTLPGACLYVYFPIYDEELPDPARLAPWRRSARSSYEAVTACSRTAGWDSTARR